LTSRESGHARIEPQQMRTGFDRSEIVDGDDLDVPRSASAIARNTLRPMRPIR
jgi:hypothetical protein